MGDLRYNCQFEMQHLVMYHYCALCAEHLPENVYSQQVMPVEKANLLRGLLPINVPSRLQRLLCSAQAGFDAESP